MTASNADIKLVRSLREKKFRQQEGLFVVEGEKMVEEALNSGFEVVRLFRTEDIGESAMARMSSLSTPSPSLAVVRIPDLSAGDEIAPGLCLALDSVRDPGNFGTIVRLADWFGISAVYASCDCAELFNPKTVQATMGAVFRKKVYYCSLPDVCSRFIAAGRQVFGTFMEGDDIYSSSLPSDALVVMGNEARGISGTVSALVTSRIHIPSFASGPSSESLNVATAAAITISEFRRREI